MVQRGFSINTALELVDNAELECHSPSSAADALSRIPPTTVKVTKEPGGTEGLHWSRRDILVLEDEEVILGISLLQDYQAQSDGTRQREPDFESSDFCRLLHVLNDARMTRTRSMLMEPRTRADLDAESVDVWTDHIAPLFNDATFEPPAFRRFAGAVTVADISGIDSSRCTSTRHSGVLKRKFGEFKSLYGTCFSLFEASGQGDSEGFLYFANGKNYIMYAFCFLKAHPILQPLATCALQREA